MPDPIDWYRRMLQIRVFEDQASELHKAGEIRGSMHLCSGHEAVAVGAVHALAGRGTVSATYRGHGWALALGVPMSSMFAELMGRASGLCGGRGGSAFFSAPEYGFLGENSIVGAGVPIAVGAALASQRKGQAEVAIAVIGDGAVNQGATHEAWNFAAVMGLPLVTIIENNGWSELTPIEDMSRSSSLASRGAAYGMDFRVGDGRDPSEVAHYVGWAVDHALRGQGPTLLEFRCDRLGGHYFGDPQTYRRPGELDRARAVEPLSRLRAEHPGHAAEFAAIDREVNAEVADAVAQAKLVDFAHPGSVKDHLYA